MAERPAGDGGGAAAVGGLQEVGQGAHAGALADGGQGGGLGFLGEAGLGFRGCGCGSSSGSGSGRGRRELGGDERGRPVDVGRAAGQGGLLAPDPLGYQVSELLEPFPGPGGGHQERDGIEPCFRQQPSEVLRDRFGVRRGQLVALVEDDDQRLLVVVQLLEVALVPGSVGILLGIRDEQQQIRCRGRAVGLVAMRPHGRIVVRQVDQHQRCQLGLGAPMRSVQQRAPQGPVVGGDSDAVQQGAGPVGPIGIPNTRQARGRGGPDRPDRRQIEPDQGIEQRRLAAPGRPRDGGDDVIGRQRDALVHPQQDAAHFGGDRSGEPVLGVLQEVFEGCQAGGEGARVRRAARLCPFRPGIAFPVRFGIDFHP